LEFKRDKYFVDEAETQLREKSLRGSQTQDNHYLEDTASTLKLILTYDFDTKPIGNASQPSLLLEEVFNGILYLRANP